MNANSFVHILANQLLCQNCFRFCDCYDYLKLYSSLGKYEINIGISISKHAYLTAKNAGCIIVATKTFPENWDSKAPSVGTLLAYLETTA